jgi:hypothetical protein
LREERRLRAFENRVLRIFGPKRDEVTGEWRKVYEEFNDLYPPSNVRVIKLRRMRRAGQVERMGERRGGYRVLVGKPVGKTPLGRPRPRWEDNIRQTFRKWDGAMIGFIWLRTGTGGGHL